MSVADLCHEIPILIRCDVLCVKTDENEFSQLQSKTIHFSRMVMCMSDHSIHARADPRCKASSYGQDALIMGLDQTWKVAGTVARNIEIIRLYCA
jgi:hypothetical protein